MRQLAIQPYGGVLEYKLESCTEICDVIIFVLTVRVVNGCHGPSAPCAGATPRSPEKVAVFVE